MRKILTIVLVSLLLISGSAYAIGSWARYYSINVATATATAVCSKPGYLSTIIIQGDRASTCSYNVYDYATNQTVATTTEFKIIPTMVVTTSEFITVRHLPIIPPAHFYHGLYVTVSSTGEIMLYYEFE